MIHFKNLEGSSFIEVIIAVAIMGIFFVSGISLLYTSFGRDVNYNQRTERILLLKNVLYSPSVFRDKHDQVLERKQAIKSPPSDILIDVSLQKKKNFVERILATATWDGLVGKKEEGMLLLQFREPKSKENA